MAWPLAAVLLGLAFRKPLARLIPTLRRARYKDLEFDFGEELRSLEKKAVELKVASTTSLTAASSPEADRAVDQARGELDRAAALAKDYPEPAVLVAWDAVEAELYKAAERRGLVDRNEPRISATKLISSLREHDVISEDTADFLRRLRNLRNVVMHPNGVLISTDEAREYLAIARNVAHTLRSS